MQNALGRHAGEVQHPELVGRGDGELTIDLVIRAGLRRIRDRGSLLAAHNPF